MVGRDSVEPSASCCGNSVSKSMSESKSKISIGQSFAFSFWVAPQSVAPPEFWQDDVGKTIRARRWRQDDVGKTIRAPIGARLAMGKVMSFPNVFFI